MAAISDVRADAGYMAWLLSIARHEQSAEAPKFEEDPRSVTLAVLAAGTVKTSQALLQSLIFFLQEHCEIYRPYLLHHPPPSLTLTRMSFYPSFNPSSARYLSQMLLTPYKS